MKKTETYQDPPHILVKIRDMPIRHFASSVDLSLHPMRLFKPKLKMQYFVALDYFVKQSPNYDDFMNARLFQYKVMLVGDSKIPTLTDNKRTSAICSVVNSSFRPWRRKYCYWLLCDIALILLDEAAIKRTYDLLQSYLGKKRGLLLGRLFDALWNDKLDVLFAALWDDKEVPVSVAESLLSQFRANRRFDTQPEMRFIVTANISAGKSTLINALVGKTIMRTAQEVCTTNLCYLYNKPFEDSAVHLLASSLNLNASYDALVGSKRTTASYVASFFKSMVQPQNQVCIIDTPGVNSALNHGHSGLACNALRKEKYHKVIFVLNANKIGTDDEIRHLRWISENVPQDKVVFVLNKLDDFKKSEDSIAMSFIGIRNDLLGLGYKNPVICPLSAYFALLIKMKQNGDVLSDDEQDSYNLYTKKFRKAQYDLSLFYDGLEFSDGDDEATLMSKKCGLYGLEKILFGGIGDEKGRY